MVDLAVDRQCLYRARKSLAFASSSRFQMYLFPRFPNSAILQQLTKSFESFTLYIRLLVWLTLLLSLLSMEKCTLRSRQCSNCHFCNVYTLSLLCPCTAICRDHIQIKISEMFSFKIFAEKRKTEGIFFVSFWRIVYRDLSKVNDWVIMVVICPYKEWNTALDIWNNDTDIFQNYGIRECKINLDLMKRFRIVISPIFS